MHVDFDGIGAGFFFAHALTPTTATLVNRLMEARDSRQLSRLKAQLASVKLLIIDELSLGLAPVIVGQLLEMVRKINATGTAVIMATVVLSAANLRCIRPGRGLPPKFLAWKRTSSPSIARTR